MATQITALPIPPSRQDPANFAARADAFLGALPTFRNEANLLATEAEQDAMTASAAATSASNSAASALASKNAAEAAFDSFDDRYLGAKNTDPTTDNDGQPLLIGSLYYNTTVPEMRVYNGTSWVSVGVIGGTVQNLTVTGTFIPPNDSIALGTKTTGNYIATGSVTGNGLSGSSNTEGGNFVINSNGTPSNTGSTLVFRDASGNFSAGTITANLNGNASTSSNSNQLNGFGSDTNGSANSIVRRDGSGYIYTPYFNQTSNNNENPSISQIMVTNGGDNFLRKASIAHLGNSLNTNGYRFVVNRVGDQPYLAARAFGSFIFDINIVNDAVNGILASTLNVQGVSSISYLGIQNSRYLFRINFSGGIQNINYTIVSSVTYISVNANDADFNSDNSNLYFSTAQAAFYDRKTSSVKFSVVDPEVDFRINFAIFE